MLKRSLLALPLGVLCLAAPPAATPKWLIAGQSALTVPAKDWTLQAVPYYARATPWNMQLTVRREDGNGAASLMKPKDKVKLKAGQKYYLTYWYDTTAAPNDKGQLEGFGQVQFVDEKNKAVTMVIHLTPESQLTKIELDLEHNLTPEGIEAVKQVVSLKKDVMPETQPNALPKAPTIVFHKATVE